ncbi:MAG TPA: hypothetical protein VHX14_00030 [Thermoanaerobaculia bacterium]|jgi:hypothetical protein|nr:hypothetical protein [Thermoanaerobaculia bacterium]
MPESIKYAGSVSVPGGPSLAFTETMPLESYTKISAEVPPSDKATVDTKGSEIALLLVRATDYSSLNYTVDSEVVTSKTPLAVPLLVGGAGAIGRLSKKGLESLTFYNGLTVPVTVEVFIGRT